jgi:hypothetical protein
MPANDLTNELTNESTESTEWTKVSAQQPCAVCSGQTGCLRGSDGEFACCARVPSDWPLAAGGWVHRVAQTDGRLRRDR